MLQNNYWIGIAFLVCIYLLWSAEHLTGPKEKLKRSWRNRIVWQYENTTLLRSSHVQMNEKVADGAVNITVNTSNITANASNITANASNITANASNITANASNITANASNITANTSNITANASNITANASNITANASNLNTGLESSGTGFIPSAKTFSHLPLSVISHCTVGGKRYTKELQQASFANKRRWCNAIGVKCYLLSHNIHEEHDAHNNRGKQWDKIVSFRDTLKKLPENHWLLWLDCDAIFTNTTTKIFHQLTATDKELIFNKDYNGLNFGVFMMKRTNWTLAFLNRIYEGIHTETHINAEQTYTRKLIKQYSEVRNKIQWVDQKKMNAYYMNPYGAKWSKGDWILHQVSCHNQPKCNRAFINIASTHVKFRKKCLEFVHITKTGGTAIEFAAAQVGIGWGACQWIRPEFCNGAPNPNKMYNGIVQWHDPHTTYDCPNLFAVVRNPYERVLSEYVYAGKRKEYGHGGKNLVDLNEWILQSLMSVEKLGHIYDFHLQRQSDYIENMNISHILKYETLDVDFEKLMKLYRLNVNITKRKNVGIVKLDISQLNSTAIKKIEEVYKKDFELFGYNNPHEIEKNTKSIDQKPISIHTLLSEYTKEKKYNGTICTSTFYFVTGFHHSGTTIVQHSILRALGYKITKRYPETVPKGCPQSFSVFKMPSNTPSRLMDFIKLRKKYPNIRIIYLERDIPNVIWSLIKRQYKNSMNVQNFKRVDEKLFNVPKIKEMSIRILETVCSIHKTWRAHKFNENDFSLNLYSFTRQPIVYLKNILGLTYGRRLDATNMPDSSKHELRREWQAKHAIYPNDVDLYTKEMPMNFSSWLSTMKCND